MQKNGVACLLMGGQACILYGGAEFSRDLDLAIDGAAENLVFLQSALAELQAECIAVPPFAQQYLEMGLAIHFRCQHADAAKMRIDVMSRMRGVDPFHLLWQRRTTLAQEGEAPIDLLGLPDLVQAKKTQRDKDWPMIARLLEAHYLQNSANPTATQITFWLAQMRSPMLLREIVQRFPQEGVHASAQRPLLSFAHAGDEPGLIHALREEEDRERAADRAYWLPLKQELERLRLQARS